jgi:hypothetical protein
VLVQNATPHIIIDTLPVYLENKQKIREISGLDKDEIEWGNTPVQ